jgi:hypothetical protein
VAAVELKCFAPGQIADLARRFTHADPWPHIVVDDVLAAETLSAAVGEAHAIPTESLLVEDTKRIRKLATNDVGLLGPTLRRLLDQLNDDEFVAAVREITGIEDLVIDPGRLRAGLFITPAGGWQRLHEDFPKHPVSGLWARVIVLLYLSDWHVGAGGELDMWSRDMTRSATVQPVPGRMVLCATDTRCRHGVLRVDPAGEPRVAVAARFYSPTPPPMKPGFGVLRTFRRPGDRLIDVVPTLGDVVTYLRPRLPSRAGK